MIGQLIIEDELNKTTKEIRYLRYEIKDLKKLLLIKTKLECGILTQNQAKEELENENTN